MAEHNGISFEELAQLVNEQTQQVQAKIKSMKDRGDDISIGEMFEMQMLMNMLSQLSEMSTQVVAASHGAIISVARNIK